jgi:hypothetical protein
MERSTIRRSSVALAAFAMVVTALASPAAAIQTPNMSLVQNIRFESGGGNEISFDGDLIYVGQYRSPGDVIKVLKITGGGVKKIADVPCGGHNDMAVLDDGYLAVSFQATGTKCDELAPSVPVGGTNVEPGGVQVINVANPNRPSYHGNVVIAGGTHTLTRLPGKPYIYAALGGAEKYAVHGGGTHIIDVSDPEKPKVAAVYKSPLNPAGCHDVAFARLRGKMIGFCPGLGGTEIWDVTDPKAPAAIGRALLPFGQLPHTVAVSSDGKLLAIGDEAYTAHGCDPASPAGAIWFHDITDLANPTLVGYVGPPRGRAPVGVTTGNALSCTAHNFNFIPGTKTLVGAWVGAGLNVIDVSDPAAPTEEAWYLPDDAVTMSAYWYRGLIFTGDFDRGVDVLRYRRN